MAKETHISKKTGNKVIVERYENNVLIVKNRKGKFLRKYERKDMSVFNKKYEAINNSKG